MGIVWFRQYACARRHRALWEILILGSASRSFPADHRAVVLSACVSVCVRACVRACVGVCDSHCDMEHLPLSASRAHRRRPATELEPSR